MRKFSEFNLIMFSIRNLFSLSRLFGMHWLLLLQNAIWVDFLGIIIFLEFVLEQHTLS